MPRSSQMRRKYDPVYGALDGEVEIVGAEPFVAQGDGAGQLIAPGFDLLQELLVHRGRALFLDGAGEFVEGAFEDGFLGEEPREIIPTLDVLLVGEIHHPRHMGLVGFGGLEAAIIDGEFLKIGEDGQGHVDIPGVSPKLVGGRSVFFDVDGGFLGFHEELAHPADSEGVIRSLGGHADL